MTLDLGAAYRAPATAQRMAQAATRFVDTLDAPRRAVARFAFADEERFRWNYRPDGFDWAGRTFWHEGLRLINMTPEQQAAALALLGSGMSEQGAGRARAIMTLESNLRDTERITRFVHHVVRDPELYSFAVFGEPGGSEPWSWRCGGHHLGIHFTILEGDQVSPTPLFFGANPARVIHGPGAGLVTLPEEEDRARDLLRSLTPERRALAVVGTEVPPDIISDAYRRANPAQQPVGLSFGAMSGSERERLVALIRVYLDRTTEEIAAGEWQKLERAGLESITFAWIGGGEPGQPHYYAVKGPTFMIEYDKIQDGANHIHSVWRDFTNDWGEDLLAAHYAESHRR